MATATEPTRIDDKTIRDATGDTVTPGQQAKLVEVPRIAIHVDESDPTVIKLSFSGGVELDRTNADNVNFYNALTAGKTKGLKVDVHIAGAKNSHRRDSEGNVDAVVQTKSLIVTDVTLQAA